ncbi:MAG: chemotaxis protein CheW [Pyrinomonadaceae bacterium]|nr:chemotaxis protein CheW [Pyrinomonadaceae bacterium]
MKDFVSENQFSRDLPPPASAEFSALPSRQSGGEQYLVFCAGGDQLYAVTSKNVVEAMSSLPLTILPNAPEWLLGIANLRGEVVSVLNLAAILQKDLPKTTPKTKFIVLRSQIFESGAAFPADKISEIVTISSAEIQCGADKDSPHIYGQVAFKSQTLNLIDTEKLLASLKL